MTIGLLDPRTDVPVDMVNPVNRLHPLNRGLVSWWLALPGTMGGSRFMDIMSPGPNGNHGVLTNMNPVSDWIGSSRLNGWGALDFNVSDNSIDAGDIDLDNTSFTVTAWVKTVDLAADQRTIIAKRSTNAQNRGIVFRIELDGSLSFWTFAASSRKTTAANLITINNYINVAVVFNSLDNGGKLYVDGMLKPNSQADGALDDVVSSGNPFLIGRRIENSPFDPFSGEMDDVRLYRRVLSDNEVAWYHQLSQQEYPGMLNRLP